MSLSNTEKLKVEIVGHVAKVTIDNPAANTWDTESLPGLADLVEKLNADRNLYALVITGEGEKFFSAGAARRAGGDDGRARPAFAGQPTRRLRHAIQKPQRRSCSSRSKSVSCREIVMEPASI